MLNQIIDPYIPHKRENDSKNRIIIQCSSEKNGFLWLILLASYFGLLLIAGVLMSFGTRKVPDTHKESRWITFATYNLVFVSVIALPVSIAVGDSPKASFIMQATGIVLGALGIWVCLFWPKFYMLWFVDPLKWDTSLELNNSK
eukprot:TRINITY_DN17048_c0_g1_i1.p1 TRINITY_DN17048_c0_g1~~TRINITY_DN17048_c0_g1_i1.p1  ORF type:complete len:144 (-),score=11.46 TRINITY_DN17048_c0_g1_i1:72-503(-)